MEPAVGLMLVRLVHYAIAEALRNAGGSDSNYAGFELSFAW
jgi:hypothetical protein